MEIRAVFAAQDRAAWWYDPTTDRLHVPARLTSRVPAEVWEGLSPSQRARMTWTRPDLYRLLHEMGHIALRHRATGNRLLDIAQEKAAWQYAADCLREEYHPELYAEAEDCLRTYEEVWNG